MPRDIELEQLEAALHRDFGTVLAPLAHGSADDKRRNFLSRALAGFLVHKLAGCDHATAGNAVLDASSDGGIDAVHLDRPQNTLWLIQSKYIESGDGEPDLGGLLKFLTGIDNLLRGHHETFLANTAWRTKLPLIQRALEQGGFQVRAGIVYSSFRVMAEDRKVAIDRLIANYNDQDYLQVASYNLLTLHRYLVTDTMPTGVDNVELDILHPSRVTTPYATVSGQVRASNLLALYREHGEKLIASNIRKYKGSTSVNEQIARTAHEEPDRFFYLNNGLTAFCARWNLRYEDRPSTERQRITAHGFSVVKGAQTLGSLAKGLAKAGARPEDCMVQVKLISLERETDEAAFARTITHSTNYQNTIGPRDFVALDEQQLAIARTLSISSIKYHYKDAEDTPLPDGENLTFDEAVVALACAEHENACDLVARVLANKRSLYSFEEAYPDREDYRTRYHRLFPPTLSARGLWRAVQVYRQVFTQLLDDARNASGIRRVFFESARPLVLNLVFLRSGLELKDGMALTQEEESSVRAMASEYAERLWTVCEQKGFVGRLGTPVPGEAYEAPRSFRSVFCVATDCQNLRGGTLAVLNRPANAPSPNSATET